MEPKVAATAGEAGAKKTIILDVNKFEKQMQENSIFTRPPQLQKGLLIQPVRDNINTTDFPKIL